MSCRDWVLGERNLLWRGLARAERALGVQNKVLYFKAGGPLVEELRKESLAND